MNEKAVLHVLHFFAGILAIPGINSADTAVDFADHEKGISPAETIESGRADSPD